MANFGALGTLRNAYQTLNKPSTSALVTSVFPPRCSPKGRQHRSSKILRSAWAFSPPTLHGEDGGALRRTARYEFPGFVCSDCLKSLIAAEIRYSARSVRFRGNRPEGLQAGLSKVSTGQRSNQLSYVPFLFS